MSDVFAQEKATATTSYSDLVDNQVAVVPFTLVVSQDISSQVENLTTQQIKDIYAGNITNWSQVGGPNEPITVVVRTKTSGTRATFDKFVVNDAKQTNDEPAGAQTADSTGELVTDISNSHGAIGYTGYQLCVESCTDRQDLPDLHRRFWRDKGHYQFRQIHVLEHRACLYQRNAGLR